MACAAKKKKAHPWSLRVHRPAAEHFVIFLYNTHHLKDDYSLTKSELNHAFRIEYQPLYYWNKPPFGVLSLLLRYNLVNKATYDQDLNIVLFNAEKINSLINKLDLSAKDGVPPPLDEKLSQPVETFVSSQQAAFRPKQQRKSGLTHQWCDLCKVTIISEASYNTHKDGEIHRLRSDYRNNKKVLCTSNDVYAYVSKNAIGLEKCSARISEEGILRLNIENSSNTVKYIDNVIPLASVPEVKMRHTEIPLNVIPNATVPVLLAYKFANVGSYLYPIVLRVRKASDKDDSYILKEIVFDCQSEVVDDLGPVSEFKPARPPKFKIAEGPIVNGIRPPSIRTGLVMKRPFVKSEIPNHLRTLLNHELKTYPNISENLQLKLKVLKDLLGLDEEMNIVKRCVLQPETYCEIFSTLLHIEEHQMEIDIRNYDCSGKVLEKVERSSLFALDVPGLAENRPSVLRGDSIFVMFEGDANKVRYEGCVHQIKETKVHLGLNKRYVDKMKLHVQFNFNRYSLKVEHRAINILSKGSGAKFVLPKKPQGMEKQIVPIRIWKNRNVENNEQQKIAVTNIVNNTAHPAPYIVFGPPGTGKTVTIVEAIVQLWDLHRADNKQHILVCAPSNAAADVVAIRLLNYIPESALLRLYASSHSLNAVPEVLRKCSNFDERGSVYYSTKEQIMKFPIIVVTLVTAGRLVGANIPVGHYSHVFVDECGHAVEPEVLVPIAGLLVGDHPPAKMSGQLVLAGDPKQLGPILRSPLAYRLGLEMSLLERLMEDEEMYKRCPDSNKYNSAVLTKLVKNYRSHASILAVPNRQFYDGELQVCGGPEITLACSWEELPKKNFPVIFHGVQGRDQREASSPSFFNLQEIDVILGYLDKLFQDRLNGRKIRPNDIGIVTPYRKQVEKMRAALKKRQWNSVDVGSVENFQGQERLIIIVSTVRSTQKFVSDDYKFNLGFLKNPKRLNVALTRAKALLIVVGNPNILQCDENWRAFITYCQDNGAYRGMRFTPVHEDDVALEGLVNGVANLCLATGSFPLLKTLMQTEFLQGYLALQQYVSGILKEGQTTDVLNVLHGLREQHSTIVSQTVSMLGIPTSNADSERAFSAYRHILTDLRTGIKPNNIELMLAKYFGASM